MFPADRFENISLVDLSHIYNFNEKGLKQLHCSNDDIKILMDIKTNNRDIKDVYEDYYWVYVLKYYIISNNYDIQQYLSNNMIEHLHEFVKRFYHVEKCKGSGCLQYSDDDDYMYKILISALDNNVNIDFIYTGVPCECSIIKLVLLMLEYNINLWDYLFIKYTPAQLREIELGLKHGLFNKVKIYMIKKITRDKTAKYNSR